MAPEHIDACYVYNINLQGEHRVSSVLYNSFGRLDHVPTTSRRAIPLLQRARVKCHSFQTPCGSTLRACVASSALQRHQTCWSNLTLHLEVPTAQVRSWGLLWVNSRCSFSATSKVIGISLRSRVLYPRKFLRHVCIRLAFTDVHALDCMLSSRSRIRLLAS